MGDRADAPGAPGIDQDLRPFYERFRFDPLIGRAVRANLGLRAAGRPDPFEALVFAVCEQLIGYERAAAIQRRLIAPGWGAAVAVSGLRDAPTAAVLAGQAPALLASFDLNPSRALTVRPRGPRGGQRARRPRCPPTMRRAGGACAGSTGIGSWTVQTLALTGQGRLDQLPAGDLAYLKLVGRLRGGGDPYARATEDEVEEFFAPYAPWAGLGRAARAAPGGQRGHAARGARGRPSTAGAAGRPVLRPLAGEQLIRRRVDDRSRI